jgi:hypothetical protein
MKSMCPVGGDALVEAHRRIGEPERVPLLRLCLDDPAGGVLVGRELERSGALLEREVRFCEGADHVRDHARDVGAGPVGGVLQHARRDRAVVQMGIRRIETAAAQAHSGYSCH